MRLPLHRWLLRNEEDPGRVQCQERKSCAHFSMGNQAQEHFRVCPPTVPNGAFPILEYTPIGLRKRVNKLELEGKAEITALARPLSQRNPQTGLHFNTTHQILNGDACRVLSLLVVHARFYCGGAYKSNSECGRSSSPTATSSKFKNCS